MVDIRPLKGMQECKTGLMNEWKDIQTAYSEKKLENLDDFMIKFSQTFIDCTQFIDNNVVECGVPLFNVLSSVVEIVKGAYTYDLDIFHYKNQLLTIETNVSSIVQ